MIVIILLFIQGIQHVFVGFRYHSSVNSLTEQHQRACIKWWCFLIPRQPDKVLQIRVFCDLLNQFPVRILELCLYDQGAKCCTKRLCNISSLYFKKSGILLFKNIPRDGISHLDPTVVRIHMKPQWLIKIQKRKCDLPTSLYMNFSSFYMVFCRKTARKINSKY